MKGPFRNERTEYWFTVWRRNKFWTLFQKVRKLRETLPDDRSPNYRKQDQVLICGPENPAQNNCRALPETSGIEFEFLSAGASAVVNQALPGIEKGSVGELAKRRGIFALLVWLTFPSKTPQMYTHAHTDPNFSANSFLISRRLSAHRHFWRDDLPRGIL